MIKVIIDEEQNFTLHGKNRNIHKRRHQNIYNLAWPFVL